MRAKTPIKNRRIDQKEALNLKGFVSFGRNNSFPQDLLDAIFDSPTASACMGVRSQFITGNGFTDTNLSKLIIHRTGLKMDEALRRISANVSALEAIAIHVNYNALGKITGIKPVPVEVVRLGKPDDMGYNYYAGVFPFMNDQDKPQNRNKGTQINLFNPTPEVVQEQIALAGGIEKYPGQLIYEPFWMPGDETYHKPSFFSCIKDMETEMELSVYDYKTVTNGFNISGIFAYLGRKPEPIRNEDGQITGQPDDEITQQIASYQGAENAASVMTISAESKEELELMKFFDTTGAALADRYNSTNQRVSERITRAWRVPAILANIQQGSSIFADTAALESASQYMQAQVNDYQRKITETMETIFANWYKPLPFADFSIQNLNYFQSNGTVVNAQ